MMRTSRSQIHCRLGFNEIDKARTPTKTAAQFVSEREASSAYPFGHGFRVSQQQRVAQLVARLVGGQEVAGAEPATLTKRA